MLRRREGKQGGKLDFTGGKHSFDFTADLGAGLKQAYGRKKSKSKVSEFTSTHDRTGWGL